MPRLCPMKTVKTPSKYEKISCNFRKPSNFSGVNVIFLIKANSSRGEDAKPGSHDYEIDRLPKRIDVCI
jgi:hypothetical protein